MPSSISETAQGVYAAISAELPGRGVETIGIVLEDPATDTLYVKFRRDWEEIAEPEDAEVLEAVAADFASGAQKIGGEALLARLEDTLSNTLRISDRETVLVENFERALERLYRRHVQPKVLPFRTHLPLYTLRVAAGRFLENEEVQEEGWQEAPEDLRLTPDMFVARIAGHSMEPLIPDGSLCVFRAGVRGSRDGRLVLVEDLQTTGTNRYTVKRYRSEKTSDGDESAWRHRHIRLESLNPDYPSWDLEPDEEKFRIIAEFDRVLERPA